MKAPGFFYDRSRSKAMSSALVPLRIASWAYGAGASLHARIYASESRRRRLACGVVSVGSPMVGGTGKTPMAARVASLLQADGYRVALASRGYGAMPDEAVTVVSDGASVLSSADRVGDEPLVLAAHAPGIPVVVARDRGLAGLRAIADFGIDILVLDDGFGHHRLARDLEIVTFEGRMGLGNGHILPRGPLKEGLAGLSRADAVVVVDGPLPEVDQTEILSRASNSVCFRSSRRASRLWSLNTAAPSSLDSLEGKEVGLLSGVAYPTSFERLIESLGSRVVARRIFADHHRYRPVDVANLSSEASVWLATEKDAVKLKPDWVVGSDVRVLEIEMEPDAAFVRWLSESVRARVAPRSI